jgi:hypothetical protein
LAVAERVVAGLSVAERVVAGLAVAYLAVKPEGGNSGR